MQENRIDITASERYIRANNIYNFKSGNGFAILSLFAAAFLVILTIAAYAWSDSSSDIEKNSSPATENSSNAIPAGEALPPIKKKDGNMRTNPTVPTDNNSANNPSTSEGKVIDKDNPAPNSPSGSEDLR